MTSPIRLDIDGKVAVLTIDRNERRNSLDNDAIEAFLAALAQVRRSDVVSLVITAVGDRSFCAGSDLKALKTYSEEEVAHHTHLFQLLTETLDELPCATIAAIEGACLGGGLEIALACDSRIADQAARFGFPEITVGVLPTGGGTIRAPRTIGLARAREMMLFGEPMGADEALSIGLVSRVVSGDVRAVARARAEQLASQTHREAVMLLKALLVTGAGVSPRVGAAMAYLSDVALSRSPHFLKTMEPKKS
ncbi:MAG: enoyl-CoA hydratase/isomerase family protein [Rhodobacteraceae bacterium]|nr:enoyl-CoA hydratase/isomerase family protein [Paracoccaceae bacterium]